LLLLVLRVLADDPYDAIASDHLAFIAYLLNASPDFHNELLVREAEAGSLSLAIVNLLAERIYRFLDLI
jgi:hypothetical protein